MRQSCRSGHLTDIVVRRLHRVAQRQCVIYKMRSGVTADVDKFSRRKFPELSLCTVLVSEVAADQPAVRLADFDEFLASSVMRHTRYVQALVGFALTKNRN